jgi:phage tail sheath protein FI
MTPGVYIEEKNAFPGSAVAVETAVPVFIGYTEIAERKGISLVGDPIRVSSFAEYIQWYGHGYHHQFGLSDTPDSPPSSPPSVITKFNSDMVTKPAEMFYFYNCMRLFFQNGGSNCYILSIGTYGEGAKQKTSVDVADLPDELFTKLEKTFEPTMVLIPDFVTKRDDCYNLYKKVLRHCEKTQSRFGIFDVIPADEDASMEDTFLKFRDGVGSEALKYGAAYYPWVNTSIVLASELNFTNLAVTPEQLKTILPEKDVATVIDKWNNANNPASPPASPPAPETEEDKNKRVAREITNLHQSLLATSITYTQIMAEVRNKLNLLPPSAAMAGVYSLVDSTRGVWKAPANVSLSMVSSPDVNISSDEQQKMNVDAITGKSINAIRPFPGLGSLVWGARTLDGNSQDWRYINVRRTMIMIEQSLKLACRAYVFEPNDSSTWVTMKSMMNNFLNNLWKQGALAGAVPEQAFDVQVGLGATMTPTDILDGYLLVTVKLALVRPAEFIVLTFQQQQQQS